MWKSSMWPEKSAVDSPLILKSFRENYANFASAHPKEIHFCNFRILILCSCKSLFVDCDILGLVTCSNTEIYQKAFCLLLRCCMASSTQQC